MPTKRLSSSAAKQGRTSVSALAITVAVALGTLAMPAFSADAKPAAKEDTITVVGGSNTAQQESARAGRHLCRQTQRHRHQNRYADREEPAVRFRGDA